MRVGRFMPSRSPKVGVISLARSMPEDVGAPQAHRNFDRNTGYISAAVSAQSALRLPLRLVALSLFLRRNGCRRTLSGLVLAWVLS